MWVSGFFYVEWLCYLCVLGLFDDGLESLGLVHGKVGEDLAVDFDTGFVQGTHQTAVGETFQTGGSIDTLNPQTTEFALFVLTVAVSIGQTLLPSILGNGPHILS